MKRLSTISIIILSMFQIIGCNPQEVPVSILPPVPKQVESSLPYVKKIETSVDKTILNNTKIENVIANNQKNIIDQKISIIESLTQAEKIKEKALANVAVTELDAINLIDELEKVESRNLFLEKQNDDLSHLTEDQKKILILVKETLDKTEDLVLLKDEETSQLRENYTTITRSIVSKNAECESLKKLLQAEKEISSSMKVYRNIMWSIVGVWLIWTILKNILLIYFPLSKFRI